MYQRPDRLYFQEPPELESQVSTGKLVQRFLPKQTDIDKILEIIQRKVLKGTHLPITMKEIKAGYLICPYFKDLYLYLAQNKLPSTKQPLLFKLITTPKKETALLAIPEACADKIITLYHSSLFQDTKAWYKCI